MILSKTAGPEERTKANRCCAASRFKKCSVEILLLGYPLMINWNRRWGCTRVCYISCESQKNLAAHMYAYFWTCWLRTRDELLNLHLALPAVCKYMQCHASQRREGCCEAPPCIALRVKRLHTEIWRHLSPRCRRRKREVPENLLARTVLGSLYQVLVLSLPSLP